MIEKRITPERTESFEQIFHIDLNMMKPILRPSMQVANLMIPVSMSEYESRNLYPDNVCHIQTCNIADAAGSPVTSSFASTHRISSDSGFTLKYSTDLDDSIRKIANKGLLKGYMVAEVVQTLVYQAEVTPPWCPQSTPLNPLILLLRDKELVALALRLCKGPKRGGWYCRRGGEDEDLMEEFISFGKSYVYHEVVKKCSKQPTTISISPYRGFLIHISSLTICRCFMLKKLCQDKSAAWQSSEANNTLGSVWRDDQAVPAPRSKEHIRKYDRGQEKQLFHLLLKALNGCLPASAVSGAGKQMLPRWPGNQKGTGSSNSQLPIGHSWFIATKLFSPRILRISLAPLHLLATWPSCRINFEQAYIVPWRARDSHRQKPWFREQTLPTGGSATTT
ncbi:hypothetical protein V8F33_008688 [Rhypophila sp. PSN 637]